MGPLRHPIRAKGGIFGYGLNAEIIAAYQWMIDDYNPDDELFIFGIVRSVHCQKLGWASFRDAVLPLPRLDDNRETRCSRGISLGDSVRTIHDC